MARPMPSTPGEGIASSERIEDFYRPGDDRLTFGKRLDQGCHQG